MSLITESRCSAEVANRLRVVALLAVDSGVSSSRPVMPITPLSGVRISWLMFARNSLLARLPSSARFLAVSSSADWSCSCAITPRARLMASDVRCRSLAA